MIQNPILKGFHPDPCICRKGDDYYLITSTFEWFPGLPVYHSKDLKNWELLTHVLCDDEQVDLKKLPSAKGIWAPCLTYSEEEDTFYVVYGIMNSMNARYFDVDNYLVKAKDIKGSWSKPVYLHSAGFDASLCHDDDGRKWIVSLEWETRKGYEKPGAICLVEYDGKQEKVIGYPKRIWGGGSDRGCIEAPHLTKKNGYYYLMCAEGGTGYNHCVTMARAKNPFGPYEKDPKNPILTSSPGYSNERHDPDHLKPQYYNPQSILQKSGHGSYVDLPNGESYLVHLCARPFLPELRCTLGRETAIQKMEWSKDGWLRMADGSNLAKIEVKEASLKPYTRETLPAKDDFDSEDLRPDYYSPRLMPKRFVDAKVREGHIRIRGQESLCSLNKVSILAKKLTGVYGLITTKVDFEPEIYQHSAGLVLYYDNMNYIFLEKTCKDSKDKPILSLLYIENGERKDIEEVTLNKENSPIYMRLKLEGRKCYFEWSNSGDNYKKIGEVFDLSKFSDEYCKYGEFTGTFVGMVCCDRMFHEKYADFDFFDYEIEEDRPIEGK